MTVIKKNIVLQYFFKITFIATFLVFVAGCAGSRIAEEANSDKELISAHAQAGAKLLAYYDDWQGTPYRLGGNSRQGIDCSAFVQNAYQSVFNVVVPRTTFYQSKLGIDVKKSEVLPGDLVLFKTSRYVRHIGVVISDNKFIHVSGIKGVMISALDNVYWRKKYWKAVRPENGISI